MSVARSVVVGVGTAAVLTLGACRRGESLPAPPATSASPVSAPATKRVVGPLTPADAQALATMNDRLKPQHGITYFVVGSGGELRAGKLDRKSSIMATGFETDRAFMAAEIIGDEMYFNAISRLGQTVDSGVLTRRKIAN